MKSGRQRRDEIRARRVIRVLIKQQTGYSTWTKVPVGALEADPDKLLHDTTYGPRPRYYDDRPFTCTECGANEVWTAAQQKWWYEVAKGKIGSAANRCRDCRYRRRLRSSQSRRVHIEGLIAKYGIETAARRLKFTIAALEHMRARWSKD